VGFAVAAVHVGRAGELPHHSMDASRGHLSLQIAEMR
jgi:hypothetical protein